MNAEQGLRAESNSRGQVLPIFIIFLTAMLLIASLLVDGATALLMRRQYQSVADAAALAAANVIQSNPKGCSLTDPPGAPRAAVVDAARASVQANLPGYDLGGVAVTCPAEWDNYGVKVDLHGVSPGFFSQVVGITAFAIDTSAVGYNGYTVGSKYSVVLLDPYNAGWGSQYKGCPSVLFSGGPTVVFEGSLYVNSSCPAGSGGALGTNGNSATVSFAGSTGAYVVGGFNPGPLTLDPYPVVNSRRKADPLAGLSAPSGLTIKSSRALVYGSGTNTVLEAGVYVGGIQLKSTARAFMKPGVYVMQGGGLDLGAQTSLYSVKASFTLPATPSAWTDTAWATTDCPAGQCGVLIYNTAGSSGCGCSSMGAVTVGAGANLMLRHYKPGTSGNNVSVDEWDNLLLWQSASPLPTSNSRQPALALGGGGRVNITGTVYAPSAQVQMLGGSGGSGGEALNLTIQFISWDLSIQGNSSFHFVYSSNDFARPTDYGLVQ